VEDFAERFMMFAVGAIFVGGGLTFAFQSMEGQRSAFQSVIFGIAGVVVGLYLCVWTFIGPPGY
jgi:hypothetical protein